MKSNNPKVNIEVDKKIRRLQKNLLWYTKTDTKRIELDKIHQNISHIILQNLEKHGRFSRDFYGLNKMKWDTQENLLDWIRKNQMDWYEPMTGEHSPEYKKGWISPIPGDILSYPGAGKIPLFEHFGIYMGNIQGTGIMVEVRDGDTKRGEFREHGHINMLRLNELKKFTKFPLHIIQTIKYNSKFDRWIDSRVYTRQVCLWTALKTIRMGWRFEIMSPGNLADQTCQGYVNSLLFSKPHTVQLWNMITIILWVIYYWFYKKI